MIEYKKEGGKKNGYGKDEVLLIKCPEWHKITNEDLFYMIKHIVDNEERIYPKTNGFLGKDLFFQELSKYLDGTICKTN